MIMTKDADFDDEAAHPGPPPKAIHLLIGNSSTRAIDALVRSSIDEILAFEHDSERILEIG